jgi:hypothetical protein
VLNLDQASPPEEPEEANQVNSNEERIVEGNVVNIIISY